MMSTVVLITILLLPGMSEPLIMRKPMASFEECMESVRGLPENLKAHEGEEFRIMSGCQVTGTKADPA